MQGRRRTVREGRCDDAGREALKRSPYYLPGVQRGRTRKPEDRSPTSGRALAGDFLRSGGYRPVPSFIKRGGQRGECVAPMQVQQVQHLFGAP